MTDLNISSIAAMSNAQSAAAASNSSSSNSSSTKTTGNNLANEQVFLQLLVAQLKNQDPQNPADGTQFVTQLAQFTTLEQETQSRTDLDSIVKTLKNSTVLNPPAASSTANPSTQSTTN